jgi:outer membrane protein OmpA-like peptidoglycan-associated protein
MLSSKEERLAIADRRANAIRDMLVRKGFASQNISTVAYDKGPECKAVIVEIR